VKRWDQCVEVKEDYVEGKFFKESIFFVKKM
jgi:hypothetical protein